MRLACIAVWLMMGADAMAGAQMGVSIGTQTQAGSPNGMPSSDRKGTDIGPFEAVQRERLEKGRQTERQKKLQADTERLLALATELKSEMDKTTKDTLSIDVIKKAEQIEKLAKSVKERMKG